MEIYVYFLIKDEVKEHKTLDQAIYKHFNKTLWKTIKSYGSTFSSDLRELRRLNGKLERYCKWPFRDTVCTTMKRGDKDYVTYLKAKYQDVTNIQLNSDLLHLKSSLEFYFNTTSKEIQRYLDSQ